MKFASQIFRIYGMYPSSVIDVHIHRWHHLCIIVCMVFVWGGTTVDCEVFAKTCWAELSKSSENFTEKCFRWAVATFSGSRPWEPGNKTVGEREPKQCQQHVEMHWHWKCLIFVIRQYRYFCNTKNFLIHSHLSWRDSFMYASPFVPIS